MMRAEQLLRNIVAEMEATRGWYFRCLQPHSKSIVKAREWLKKRDAETSQ